MKLTLLIIVLITWGCAADNSPENVAKNYLKAISKGNYDKAQDFVTEDSKRVIEQFSTEYPHTGEGKDFRIIEEDAGRTDSTAVVAYNWEGQEELLLVLEKKEGNWFVQLDFLEGIDPNMMREAVEEMLRGIYEESEFNPEMKLEDDTTEVQ